MRIGLRRRGRVMLNRPTNDLEDWGTCSNKDCDCNNSGICYLVGKFGIGDISCCLMTWNTWAPIKKHKIVNVILELEIGKD